MIIHEVLPRLARRGFATARIGITGWSMGGYGALLLAERLGPRQVAAVAVSSAAIFASYSAAQAANPGAFDSAANFAAYDLHDGLGTLRQLPVLIDCGGRSGAVRAVGPGPAVAYARTGGGSGWAETPDDPGPIGTVPHDDL
jgi:hypothetical protein